MKPQQFIFDWTPMLGATAMFIWAAPNPTEILGTHIQTNWPVNYNRMRGAYVTCNVSVNYNFSTGKNGVDGFRLTSSTMLTLVKSQVDAFTIVSGTNLLVQLFQ